MKLLSKKFLGSRSDLKSCGEKGKGKEEKLSKWLAARNFGGEQVYLVRNFRVFLLCSLLFKSSFISLFTFHIALTTTKVLWTWNFALLTVFLFFFFFEKMVYGILSMASQGTQVENSVLFMRNLLKWVTLMRMGGAIL